MAFESRPILILKKSLLEYDVWLQEHKRHTKYEKMKKERGEIQKALDDLSASSSIAPANRTYSAAHAKVDIRRAFRAGVMNDEKMLIYILAEYE